MGLTGMNWVDMYNLFVLFYCVHMIQGIKEFLAALCSLDQRVLF